jgi:hypothetical protein
MKLSAVQVIQSTFGNAALLPIGDQEERNRQTLADLVAAYASQDVDRIMSLFADDAVYCDILGAGPRGDEYHGKVAIRAAVERQFDLTGPHIYVDPHIQVSNKFGFASWTLVLGDANDLSAPRFEGIDAFELDEANKVTLKRAWLKGQPRLKSKLLARNPTAFLRYFGYALRTLGQ